METHYEDFKCSFKYIMKKIIIVLHNFVIALEIHLTNLSGSFMYNQFPET